MRLKKSLFARNRFREREVGAFFSRTSNGISRIPAIILAIFFTPALITTSLFSKEILLIIANILLSVGYLANFFYRIHNGEISKFEILITALILSGCFAATCMLFPPASAVTFVSILGFINKMAVVVNTYFLIKEVIIPPLKHYIEKISFMMGKDIASSYYSKPMLTLEKDRPVIDRLLNKTYHHDSFSPEYQTKELNSFNNLLLKLSQYINKYNEVIFGNLRKSDAISSLEQKIFQFTTQGDTDGSYAFINKKLSFKKTKLKLLQSAEEEILIALKESPDQQENALRFFEYNKYLNKKETSVLLQEGLMCLRSEISKQTNKISSLQKCLP